MAGKYYAVKKGRTPGVYLTWEECRRQVHGYPGAVYKSFSSQSEAQAFAGDTGPENDVPPAGRIEPENDVPPAYAFVDGSYNPDTGVYGYGGFLVAEGRRNVLQGSGAEPELASMRNVAGEIAGSMAAMELACRLGIKELAIYYDYMGIEMWATGAWKRNKKGTIEYHDFVRKVAREVKLTFIKVKGHAGIEGNEEADALAKEAAGCRTGKMDGAKESDR